MSSASKKKSQTAESKTIEREVLTSDKKKLNHLAAAEAVVADPVSLVSSDGVASLRRSIAALFTLGSKLNSGSYRYGAAQIHTDASKRITSEQVWGQMNVLMAPVIANVVAAIDQRTSAAKGPAPSKKAKKAKKSKKEKSSDPSSLKQKKIKKVKAQLDDSDEDEDDDDEGALDEKIQELLSKEKERKARRNEKRSGGTKSSKPAEGSDDKDAWRYALGHASEDDADDDGGKDGEDDEEHDDEETASEKRIRLRNRAAEAEAEDEEGGEGADDDEDEDEAALKELYGDDFEADGAKLGEDEEDAEDDEAANEDDVEGSILAEEDEVGLFREEEGKYWGDHDILADQDGTFGSGAAAPPPHDEEADDDELNNPDLTELQRKRLREERAIRKIEESRVYGAQWAMSGEAGAAKRPKDSLIDEMLDFEHAMKSVPVVTEQSTMALEERIKQRIKNKAYDDVERRAAKSAASDLVTTKRDAAIDSEKSKLSLMDLYEKEYLEKIRRAEEARNDATVSAEPLTEIEKDELRAVQMWKRLSQHLDALSNFFYAPKPVQQDLEARVRAVEQQAPAIVIESVGNFAASRAAALAPQDLYRHDIRNKFVGVTTEEMDPKEKRALRRAKKESFAATKTRKTKKDEEKKAARAAAVAAKAAKAAKASTTGSKRK